MKDEFDWLDEGKRDGWDGIGCVLVVAVVAIGFAVLVGLWKHGVILL